MSILPVSSNERAPKGKFRNRICFATKSSRFSDPFSQNGDKGVAGKRIDEVIDNSRAMIHERPGKKKKFKVPFYAEAHFQFKRVVRFFSDFLRERKSKAGLEKRFFFLSRYDKIEDLALDFIIIHETS